MSGKLIEPRISVGNWLTLVAILFSGAGVWLVSERSQAAMGARLSVLETQQERQAERLERAIAVNVRAIERNRQSVIDTQLAAARDSERLESVDEIVRGNAAMLQQILGRAEIKN